MITTGDCLSDKAASYVDCYAYASSEKEEIAFAYTQGYRDCKEELSWKHFTDVMPKIGDSIITMYISEDFTPVYSIIEFKGEIPMDPFGNPCSWKSV